MGAIVFDNLVFDSWLTKKSEEILYKVDKEKITTEEMLVLILKAQTNHFHHVDVEFREEFKRIDQRFEQLHNKMDDRFEKMWNFQRWQGGIIFAMLGGLYLKLFLG
jgi:hypothetical protein